MIDPDPGDEDRRDVIADSCPFCGNRLNHLRVWNTPVFPPMPFTFSETPSPSAMDFADQQRIDPQQKESRAYIRDYERRAGLRP